MKLLPTILALVVLSFFSSSVRAMDLPAPDVTCTTADFLVPLSIASSTKVKSIAYHVSLLAKNLTVSDGNLAALNRCDGPDRDHLPVVTDKSGAAHLSIPLSFMPTWKRKVRVVACTTVGAYVYQQTLGPRNSFTYIFAAKDRRAASECT